MFKIKRHLIKFILFSGILICSAVAEAVEITAIDFNGGIIGQVISTGLVINENGDNIGSITADSLIMDNSGNIIGGVVPQGVAIGNDNRFLGKVHSDGIVRSLSGQELGYSLPNGLILNKQSEVIGAVLFPGLVYSAEGKIMGRVTGAGIYTNLDGKVIGFVSANGYTYRQSGEDYVLDGRLISSKMAVSLDGKFIGSLSPTGEVVNFEGKQIGIIHANNFIYDAKEEIIGRLVNTGYAFDLSGQYTGVVTYNGEVSRQGRVIGYYRADGNIVDSKGIVVGFAIDIAATATDEKGNYLGVIAPEGKILRGAEVVGQVGARGHIFKEGKKVGEILKTGPMFDALGKLRGQIMKNGNVISLSGGEIGSARSGYAFATNGTLLGGVSAGLLAVGDHEKALGMASSNSGIKIGNMQGKISPFGYVFNSDGKVIGNSFEPYAVYGADGFLYSYITPNGRLYQGDQNAKITSSGILFDKSGYKGGVINPLYTIDFNGQTLGKESQTNIIINNKGEIGYKILPNDLIVDSPKTITKALAPIKGFANRKMIALNISGDLLGYVDSSAVVSNLDGSKYGHIIFGDYIIDNNNVVVGQAIPFATVMNDKCNFLGVVNGRGDVINSREVITGRLLPNGQAVSDVGSYIGHAVFDKSLIDFDGNYAGTVSSGQGVGFDGKTLGCVDRRGRIIDANNVMRYGVIENNPVIDFENKFIGFTMPDGTVADAKSEIIGYVQPNGNVVSKSKKTLGQSFKYKVAFNNNNRFLGMIQPDGKVFGQTGEVVGEVAFDGTVVREGDEIGYALYDFYVYDENFVTYGYLTKDGVVLSMVGSKLGNIDRGFVLDKGEKVVARGNRDYIVRDASNNAVGELQLDGTVIDFSGQNIGYLSDEGVIRNKTGDEIALARPLQYYDNSGLKAEQKETPKNRENDWVDTKRVQINEIQNGEVVRTSESSQDEETRKAGSKVVGIALSPDGDVIGNIYDDDSVKQEDGTQVGFRTPDGIIVDMNYNPIGIEEAKRTSAENMFVPANAFGSGNPYGIGSKPSNLGPGGGYGQGERYDPVRKKALQQLQAQRRSNIRVGEIKSDVKVSSFTGYEEDGWPGENRAISTWRVNMSEMILEDKAIPAVLARSVYASEGFGQNIPVTAIVERNVYAEEGRNIIIPAGSRVIGKLGGEGGSGGNSGGAVKIGISWTRLIRPDGSQFTFSSAQTADAQGRSGAIGYLDEQLIKKYSMPLLYSALESTTTYFMANGHGTTTSSNGSSTESSKSQAAATARDNFVEQMNYIFDDLLKRKANIRSVTYIPAGTRIIIFPNQDLWLNSEERAKKEESKKESEEGSSDVGLTEKDPDAIAGNVTYDGNVQEDVRPVRSGSQGANTGRSNGGYSGNTPPPSTQGTVSQNTDDDIPDLL